MTDEESVLDPVSLLAEEYVARYRAGEQLALSEYTQKYPELAERIRQVLPLALLMEEVGAGVETSGRPVRPIPGLARK